MAVSLNFAEELRSRTSGFASAHLAFSHWEDMADDDPDEDDDDAAAAAAAAAADGAKPDGAAAALGGGPPGSAAAGAGAGGDTAGGGLSLGLSTLSSSLEKKYVRDVRKRKGLKVDEQIVQFGTKQRTLAKKV